MSSSDQRKSHRVPLSVFVNQEFGDTDQRLGMSTDLSMNGMSIVTLAREEVTPRKHAWVRFWLPGSEVLIHALAEIIRKHTDTDVDQYGVRFKYLFPDQRELLAGYLAAMPAAA